MKTVIVTLGARSEIQRFVVNGELNFKSTFAAEEFLREKGYGDFKIIDITTQLITLL